MKTLWIAVKEIYGLFVEDGSLAVMILVWIGVAALLLPHLPMNSAWRAPVLFLGVVVLLLENVWRAALKRSSANLAEKGKPLPSNVDVDA
jgi:membrane protein implicated in regulation of membrane protease activity